MIFCAMCDNGYAPQPMAAGGQSSGPPSGMNTSTSVRSTLISSTQACAAASSMSRPVVKRSSVKGALIG